MNLAKAIFVVFLVIYNVAGLVHGLLYVLFSTHLSVSWAASIICNATLSAFFLIYLMTLQPARTSLKLPGILLVTTSCTLLIIIDSYINVAETAPLLYGVLCGGIGSYFYVFWYSNLERPQAIGIGVGEKIPYLKLQRYDGKKLTTESFIGRPAMYIFYRGNWCSLCLSQLTEISEEFHEFYDRGVSIICISPQPEDETQKLAVTNPHQMNFMVDSSCEIAKQLGICHERGLPIGFEVLGYDSDTVYPTIVITDNEGIIVFTHQTNNHRVRPTVEQLIHVLDDVGITRETAESLLPLYNTA